MERKKRFAVNGVWLEYVLAYMHVCMHSFIDFWGIVLGRVKKVANRLSLMHGSR